MQVFLYVAYDLLREDNDKAGYELLKLTRIYVNVIMYSALENQTDETIAAGRLAINKMFTAIKVVSVLVPDFFLFLILVDQ